MMTITSGLEHVPMGLGRCRQTSCLCSAAAWCVLAGARHVCAGAQHAQGGEGACAGAHALQCGMCAGAQHV